MQTPGLIVAPLTPFASDRGQVVGAIGVQSHQDAQVAQTGADAVK
jgi:uncharacterized protein GlcG (DUF336 family)